MPAKLDDYKETIEKIHRFGKSIKARLPDGGDGISVSYDSRYGASLPENGTRPIIRQIIINIPAELPEPVLTQLTSIVAEHGHKLVIDETHQKRKLELAVKIQKQSVAEINLP